LKRSRNKCNAMLDAGISELAELGLAGVGVKSIACRPEVSTQTLYKHSPSKVAVFEAVLALLIERVDPLGTLHCDSHRGFDEPLREIVAKEMPLICDPDFVRLIRVLMVACMRCERRSRQPMAQFGE
jgi:TetR/AcrR family transcriptional regulator of autoinduction and epiphytic fitness